MKKILILIMLIASCLGANELSVAKVKYVIDGDTLMLQKGTNKPFKVRLIAIDTFETKMNYRVFKQLELLKDLRPKSKNTITKVLSFGHKAKDLVKDKFLNENIFYETYGVDKYGRKLVWIEGLNYTLVRYGLAVYYPNNLLEKVRKAYLLDLSRDANLEKRGIYKRY